MKWEKLLSSTRLGKEEIINSDDSNPRSEFQRDYDRIVFSSAFRRLQDKTQVFPLAESDYVRTRLTHSIEVSCVGRSLGTLAGEFINKKYGYDNKNPQDYGNIVAAACLAHDIGNPPFGHSGEESIRSWFQKEPEAKFPEVITDPEKKDFCKFEGNAQGFRILSRLQNAINRGGLQLTYAVLGTFSKYPRGSSILNPNPEDISEKKFGFFRDDADSFARIATELGLIKKKDNTWSRHPLAFLMEAADDICYGIIDLEDGFRVGRVSFEEVESLLKPIACNRGFNEYIYNRQDDLKGKTEYLRAKVINNLIFSAIDVFKYNYDEIMKGRFQHGLMSKICKYENLQLEKIKELSQQKVYAASNVLYIEAAGFDVLGGLLEKVVPAMVKDEKNKTPAEKKIYQLIPQQYKASCSKYTKLLSATDFISGMTDSYAVMLYRRVCGIELPRG
ncbi:deoxyguanosinetriphosphate triphosphohydrolase [Nitrosomonas sp. GH22]|nr:deoxyguanosinetriphosphate triphosphohydrolase [Nitrosomonas sp. GH22]